MTRGALCGKKVLVTAGPTWVAVDAVRVISNVSTGALGVALARKAVGMGADVDLFLGPVGFEPAVGSARIFRFTFFDDLKKLVARRLKKKTYDIILHAAAVSDYVMRPARGKLASGKKALFLRLTRAPKIINEIRRLNPDTFLVMFKLEEGVTDAVLKERARIAMKKSGANLVVANCFKKGAYRGFLLDSDDVLARCSSRECLADCLWQVLKTKGCG